MPHSFSSVFKSRVMLTCYLFLVVMMFMAFDGLPAFAMAAPLLRGGRRGNRELLGFGALDAPRIRMATPLFEADSVNPLQPMVVLKQPDSSDDFMRGTLALDLYNPDGTVDASHAMLHDDTNIFIKMGGCGLQGGDFLTLYSQWRLKADGSESLPFLAAIRVTKMADGSWANKSILSISDLMGTLPLQASQFEMSASPSGQFFAVAVPTGDSAIQVRIYHASEDAIDLRAVVNIASIETTAFSLALGDDGSLLVNNYGTVLCYDSSGALTGTNLAPPSDGSFAVVPQAREDAPDRFVMVGEAGAAADFAGVAIPGCRTYEEGVLAVLPGSPGSAKSFDTRVVASGHIVHADFGVREPKIYYRNGAGNEVFPGSAAPLFPKGVAAGFDPGTAKVSFADGADGTNVVISWFGGDTGPEFQQVCPVFVMEARVPVSPDGHVPLTPDHLKVIDALTGVSLTDGKTRFNARLTDAVCLYQGKEKSGSFTLELEQMRSGEIAFKGDHRARVHLAVVRNGVKGPSQAAEMHYISESAVTTNVASTVAAVVGVSAAVGVAGIALGAAGVFAAQKWRRRGYQSLAAAPAGAADRGQEMQEMGAQPRGVVAAQPGGRQAPRVPLGVYGGAAAVVVAPAELRRAGGAEVVAGLPVVAAPGVRRADAAVDGTVARPDGVAALPNAVIAPGAAAASGALQAAAAAGAAPVAPAPSKSIPMMPVSDPDAKHLPNEIVVLPCVFDQISKKRYLPSADAITQLKLMFENEFVVLRTSGRFDELTICKIGMALNALKAIETSGFVADIAAVVLPEILPDALLERMPYVSGAVDRLRVRLGLFGVSTSFVAFPGEEEKDSESDDDSLSDEPSSEGKSLSFFKKMWQSQAVVLARPPEFLLPLQKVLRSLTSVPRVSMPQDGRFDFDDRFSAVCTNRARASLGITPFPVTDAAVTDYFAMLRSYLASMKLNCEKGDITLTEQEEFKQQFKDFFERLDPWREHPVFRNTWSEPLAKICERYENIVAVIKLALDNERDFQKISQLARPAVAAVAGAAGVRGATEQVSPGAPRMVAAC